MDTEEAADLMLSCSGFSADADRAADKSSRRSCIHSQCDLLL